MVAALAIVAAAGAAPVGIYRNTMESDSQRRAVAKLVGESCGRGGSDSAFRIVVGKRTRECLYRTPVIGRDLEISAVARLLRGTPKALRRQAYLALDLRTGGAGAGYKLLVYPLQRKAQLLRESSDGRTKYLHVEKNVGAVQGVDRANLLRLRAFNVTRGPDKGACRIVASVGKQVVADVTDGAAGELEGRASGFSIGARKAAKGLVGSVDDVVIRVPNPFE